MSGGKNKWYRSIKDMVLEETAEDLEGLSKLGNSRDGYSVLTGSGFAEFTESAEVIM